MMRWGGVCGGGQCRVAVTSNARSKHLLLVARVIRVYLKLQFIMGVPADRDATWESQRSVTGFGEVIASHNSILNNTNNHVQPSCT